MLVGDEEGQFTLAEAISTMGALRWVLAQGEFKDTVMLAAWEKLKGACAEYSARHPGEIDDVIAQTEMRQRFEGGGL